MIKSTKLKTTSLIALSTALLMSVSATAFAQNIETATSRDETIYFGAVGLLSSEYLGSDQEEFRVLPYLSVNDYKGFDLFGTNLRYRLIEVGTGEGFGKWSLRAGPGVSYQSGRDSDDSDTLTGLEDVDGSILLGGYIRSTIGPVGLRLDAGQDVISGHDGFTADASIGTTYRTGKFGIQPSATLSWADSNHNESFFGISDAQSAASNLDAFDSDSGLYAYSFNVVAWYQVQENYSLGLFASYREFIDDAEDSPILRAEDGSTNGIFAGLSLSRKFDLSRF